MGMDSAADAWPVVPGPCVRGGSGGGAWHRIVRLAGAGGLGFIGSPKNSSP